MRSATESSEQNAKGPGAAGSEISPEQIRAELDKILASPGFVNADRLSRFLRYVVEETLDGQTDKLKETLLGIEVFGRKPTYDPACRCGGADRSSEAAGPHSRLLRNGRA